MVGKAAAAAKVPDAEVLVGRPRVLLCCGAVDVSSRMAVASCSSGVACTDCCIPGVQHSSTCPRNCPSRCRVLHCPQPDEPTGN